MFNEDRNSGAMSFGVIRQKFLYYLSDGIKYAIRGIDKDFYSDCITVIFKYPVSFMIWCWMRLKCEDSICGINGNKNGEGNINETLKPKLKPSMCDIFKDKIFLFPQSPVSCHVTVVWKK